MTPQEFAGKIKAKYPQYANMDDAELTQRMVKKYPQYASQVQVENPSAMTKGLANFMAFMGPQGGFGSNPAGKLMSYVQKPFNKAGEMAAEQLGKRQFPKTGAAVGTAIQMAPDIALTFAGGPNEAPVKSEPSFITKNLEDWSGVKPGSFSEEFRDPSLILSKGKEGAKPYYQMAQEEIENSKLLNETRDNVDLVEKAHAASLEGKLSEAEALEARKAADVLKKSKSINKTWLAGKRKAFDEIAKRSSDIASGDIAFKRGLMADSMRSVFPRNVGGRMSPFKVGEAMAMSHMGPLGKAASALFSPLAVGTGYGVAGMGARVAQNPGGVRGIVEILRRMRGLGADSNP